MAKIRNHNPASGMVARTGSAFLIEAKGRCVRENEHKKRQQQAENSTEIPHPPGKAGNTPSRSGGNSRQQRMIKDKSELTASSPLPRAKGHDGK